MEHDSGSEPIEMIDEHCYLSKLNGSKLESGCRIKKFYVRVYFVYRTLKLEKTSKGIFTLSAIAMLHRKISMTSSFHEIVPNMRWSRTYLSRTSDA